jgi:hypothetical protein
MLQLNINNDNAAISPPKSGQSPYLLLFIILVLAALATWLIPAGEFDFITRDGIKFAVKDSLHAVPQSGIYPLEIFTAIVSGMVKSAPIIFLILFTGGVLAVVESTGAIAAVLNHLSRSTHLSDTRIILIFGVIFALLGTTGVVVNAVVAFVPIGLLVARSIGLPPILGASLVYLKSCHHWANSAFGSTPTVFRNAITRPDLPAVCIHCRGVFNLACSPRAASGPWSPSTGHIGRKQNGDIWPPQTDSDNHGAGITDFHRRNN